MTRAAEADGRALLRSFGLNAQPETLHDASQQLLQAEGSADGPAYRLGWLSPELLNKSTLWWLEGNMEPRRFVPLPFFPLCKKRMMELQGLPRTLADLSKVEGALLWVRVGSNQQV